MVLAAPEMLALKVDIGTEYEKPPNEMTSEFSESESSVILQEKVLF